MAADLFADDDFLAGDTPATILNTTRGEDMFLGMAYEAAAHALSTALLTGGVRYPFSERSLATLTYAMREKIQEGFEGIIEGFIIADLERQGRRLQQEARR